MKTRDVATAAALFLEAASNAGRDLRTVQTPQGPADVIVDRCGADVVMHSGETLHVRRKDDPSPQAAPVSGACETPKNER